MSSGDSERSTAGLTALPMAAIDWTASRVGTTSEPVAPVEQEAELQPGPESEPEPEPERRPQPEPETVPTSEPQPPEPQPAGAAAEPEESSGKLVAGRAR